MRFTHLAKLGIPVLLTLPACSSSGDETGGGGAGQGSLGVAGVAGAPSFAGATSAGAPPLPGVGGAGGRGGAGGTTGGTAPVVAGAAGAPPIGGSGGSGGTAPTSAGTGAGGAAAGASAGGPSGGSSPGSGGSAPLGASGLPAPPGAADVPKPAGTPGAITVLNWAGFKSAVSYSFDDNNSSQIQNYARLQALGVRFTFFLWTGQSSASNSIWTQAFMDGHELANHTQSHQSNGSASDINAATKFITDKFGEPPYTLAAPNGAAVYTQLAKGLFFINRGVSDAVILPNGNSDPFTLPTNIPPTGAAASHFNQSVESARTQGGWRTFCIHGFSGDGAAYQPVNLDGFITHVQHVKDELKDVWIDSLRDVGAYWLGQKAFGSAMKTTTGTDTTYTWTLPDKFPPGHYLRVKVDGGTLKQNGVALPWDPHGYYEIALDPKTLTLSP